MTFRWSNTESNTDMISLAAQVACRRVPCFNLASIPALPARFGSAGVGQAMTVSSGSASRAPKGQDGLQCGAVLGVVPALILTKRLTHQ